MILNEFCQYLASRSIRRPWTVVLLAMALAASSVGLATYRLTLKTSNLDLVDPELPPVKAFNDFAGEFGTPNVLVVVLEGRNEQQLEESVDCLGPVLRNVPGVRNVVNRLPYDDATLARLKIDPYIRSYDHGMYFVFVQPSDPHSSAETIAPMVEGVRKVLRISNPHPDTVQAGLTGIPEYAINDRDTIKQDISRLSLLSFVLIFVLFIVAFQTFRRPMLAMVTLGLGVTMTLGVVSFVPGHLTLLSAFFASILFGLGIDFGIHIINQVDRAIDQGESVKDAIRGSMKILSRSLVTGALTTALVFLAMVGSGFRGFEELGLIAGIGVVLCLVLMCSVLPALLVIAGTSAKRRDHRQRASRIGRLLVSTQSKVVSILFAVSCMALPWLGLPEFDSNYLNLQPKDSEAVRLEREMVQRSNLSPQFAVFVCSSKKQAADLSDRLMDDPVVGDVRSIIDVEMVAGEEGLKGLPPEFLRGFRSEWDRYAVYAYPRNDIWEKDDQRDFITRMKDMDPGVTGMPFLGDFMVTQTKSALQTTAARALVILFICLLVDFRNGWLAGLAALPTVLTVMFMMGVMHAFGLAFNPLNVMALPVIIGIAVDDGVHLVHRFVYESGDMTATLMGAGRSVVLTSATTMAAFGSLAFTSHRGLASFAILLSIGVGSTLLISVLVLPSAMRTLYARLGDRLITGQRF